MNPNLLNSIVLIFGAIIGGILSHYFTIWKYQKDILYQKKVDSYVELSKSIISFESLCIPTNPPSTIIMSYKELLNNMNRAYLFMPEEIVSYVQNILGNPFIAFQNLTKLDQETCNNYFSFNISSKLESGKANPQISAAMVKVFTPFLTKIPQIGKKLKEDIGTVKVGIHFVKK